MGRKVAAAFGVRQPPPVEQGQQADAQTLAFLIERVQGNLMAAHQEVQKLALLFPAGALPFDQVRDAVVDVARFDVFEIGATLLKGDRAHFVRMLGAEPAADLLRSTVVASIGPVTAEAAAQSNIQTTVIPTSYTVPALVDAIEEYFQKNPS